MTDPTLARIEDELQAMRSEMATRGDVARLLAAVERIAGAPSFTADEDAPAEPPRYCGAEVGLYRCTVAAGHDWSHYDGEFGVEWWSERGPVEPVEPPRDMAASIARGLAQAAAGQVVELDPDEYRPCTEGA